MKCADSSSSGVKLIRWISSDKGGHKTRKLTASSSNLSHLWTAISNHVAACTIADKVNSTGNSDNSLLCAANFFTNRIASSKVSSVTFISNISVNTFLLYHFHWQVS